MKLAPVVLAFVALTALPPANAAWQRLSAAQKRSVNLAVNAIQGTKIIAANGIGQVDSLISDDPTLGSTVSTGSSQAVIDMGKQRVLEMVAFINDGAEGRSTISGSSDSKNWVPLGHAMFTPADRRVTIAFAGTQAKYLKVSYELSRGGAVRSFQVFGASTDKDFGVKQNSSGRGGVKLNLANAMGGSRVVYAYPTPSRSGDSSARQDSFSFPESQEKYRTIIYDLGQVRMVSEFGSVHSPRPVRFEVYTFTQLPEREDWRGRVSFDPKTFEGMTPVAKVEDPRGMGYIKVKTDKPIQARYVALRWEPDFNPPPFEVGGTMIGGEGCDPPQENQGGNGGDQSGNGGSDGTTSEGEVTTEGPPPGNYPPGGSPWGYGTAGYAGGGGSLPSDTDGDDDGGTGGTGGTTVNVSGGGTTTQLPPPAAGGSGSPNTQ